MKKLFDKNEITFAVVLIVIYAAGSGMVQGISEGIGIEFFGEMLFHIIMSAMVLVFIKKNDLMSYIGLCRSAIPAAKMWFYIPMFVSAALPVCFGIGTEYPPAALACRTVSMLCVGFLEEVIFRGFLFKGICKENTTRAIVISSVTFGIGHIVNLFNGYTGFDSIIQIVFAVCVGFMLVFVFYRTGSLLTCIGFHSLNNCLAGFTTSQALINAVGSETNAMILSLAVRIVIMLIYTIYTARLPHQETAQA